MRCPVLVVNGIVPNDRQKITTLHQLITFTSNMGKHL
jgi:hypothetical protein